VDRAAVEQPDLQVRRAGGILRVQTVDHRDEVLAVARSLPEEDVRVDRLDRHPIVAERAQPELVVAAAGVVIAELEARAARVVVHFRERVERVEVLRMPREILHRARRARHRPPELVRRPLPVTLIRVARQTPRAADVRGGSRRAARQPDRHRSVAQLLGRHAVAAAVAARQVLGGVRGGGHMDEEPAVGHVRDDEGAAGVGRGLWERRAPQPNRVLERFVVGFSRKRRRIDGARGHRRRDVDRRDRHEMDDGAGDGTAGIGARPGECLAAAHHPARELTGSGPAGLMGRCAARNDHFRHERGGEQGREQPEPSCCGDLWHVQPVVGELLNSSEADRCGTAALGSRVDCKLREPRPATRRHRTAPHCRCRATRVRCRARSRLPTAVLGSHTTRRARPPSGPPGRTHSLALLMRAGLNPCSNRSDSKERSE
jgi:hypothetical protein